MMFYALSDPTAAAVHLDTHPQCKLEGGNTHAFMSHWIDTLNTLGTNDASVTADQVFCNVFSKQGRKSYAAYNFGTVVQQVTFSDGTKLMAKPKAMTVLQPGK